MGEKTTDGYWEWESSDTRLRVGEIEMSQKDEQSHGLARKENRGQDQTAVET